jgi:signal transduction histidine kinase
MSNEECLAVRLLRGETFTDQECILVRPDGTRRQVVSSGTIVRGQAREVLLASLVSRDVTELRRLEQERREYVQAIIHDLRSPLTVASGHAQLLLQHPGLDGPAREMVRAIRTSAQRMSALLTDLTDSTRLEAGVLTLEPTSLDLRRFVIDFADRLNAGAGADRIRVVLPASLPPVQADPERLDRILSNLVGNALKYCPPETAVTIEVTLGETEAITAVSDQGPGIAPDEILHIFERFARSTLGRRRAEGLGLGLYITRGLVEAHGGRIWVESKLGQGSTFRFSLPLTSTAEGLERPVLSG